jgi:hypothetical protein
MSPRTAPRRGNIVVILFTCMLFSACAKPDVAILAPTNGARFAQCQAIQFSGTATDARDGALQGDALVWVSSSDGQIGTGTVFTRDDLSAGSHTITIVATNSYGENSSASVGITIEPAPAVTTTTAGSMTTTIPAGAKNITVDFDRALGTIKDFSGVNCGPDKSIRGYRDAGVREIRTHDADIDYNYYSLF